MLLIYFTDLDINPDLHIPGENQYIGETIKFVLFELNFKNFKIYLKVTFIMFPVKILSKFEMCIDFFAKPQICLIYTCSLDFKKNFGVIAVTRKGIYKGNYPKPPFCKYFLKKKI